MPAVRTIFIYEAFLLWAVGAQELRRYSVDSITQIPRALLFRAYREDPSWWGCLLLAAALREDIEAMHSYYESELSPSDIVEMLGEAASFAEPLDHVRNQLRTPSQSIGYQSLREGIVAYLSGDGVSVSSQLHARVQLLRLSLDDQHLVMMLLLNGFTQEEAAKELGVSERTLRYRLAKIAELLKEQEEEK